MLNARIRKRWSDGDFPIANIGAPVDLTYEAEQLGAGTDTLLICWPVSTALPMFSKKAGAR